MQSGKYLASGLQSGHLANLIGVQYKLQEGCEDMEAGKVQDAAIAFAKFRERH